jgi:hypothetical protein
VNTLRGQSVEVPNVEVGGSYSYHSAFNGWHKHMKLHNTENQGLRGLWHHDREVYGPTYVHRTYFLVLFYSEDLARDRLI